MDYTKTGILIHGFHHHNHSPKFTSEGLEDDSIYEDVYGKIIYESSTVYANSSNDANWWINSSQIGNETNHIITDSGYVPYIERLETYIVPVLFLIIFIIGVLGNGTLILIFLKHRTMRNVPNIYICSLAVGDILVIFFCVPFTSTVYTVESWPYGVVVCKFSEFIKDVSIGVSVFTLTALSADRYFAIVDPMRKLTGCRATRITCVTIAGIWIVSILLALPSALFSYIRVIDEDPKHTFQVCYPFPPELTPIYPKVLIMFKFLVYYTIPLFFIGTFYIIMARHLVLSTKNFPGESQGQQGKQIQARKKVAKMVLSFVVIFALCFFPSHVFLLWFYFDPNSEENFNAFWNCVRIIGFCLTFINSCINPITLYCLSGTFRKYFNRHLFCCGRETETERIRNRNVLACGGGGCVSMSNSGHPGYLGGDHGFRNTRNGLGGGGGGIRVGGLYRSTTTNYTVSGINNRKLRCTWESPHRHAGDIQMTNLNVATLYPIIGVAGGSSASPGTMSLGQLRNMPPSNNFPLTSISLSSSPINPDGIHVISQDVEFRKSPSHKRIAKISSPALINQLKNETESSFGSETSMHFPNIENEDERDGGP